MFARVFALGYAAQAARGELLDGDEVFEEMRELIQQRARAKTKASRR